MRRLLVIGALVVGTCAWAGESVEGSTARPQLVSDARRELTGAALLGTGTALVIAGALETALDPCTGDCEGPPILRLVAGPQTIAAGVGALIWGAVWYHRGHAARVHATAVPVLAPSPRGVQAGLYVRF